MKQPKRALGRASEGRSAPSGARAKKRANKIWIAVGCLGLMAACGEKTKATPRGLLTPDGKPVGHVAPASGEPLAPIAQAEAAPQFKDLPTGFGGSASSAPAKSIPSDPGSLGKAPAPALPAAEAPPARDLSSELVALIPPPSNCLDLELAARSGKLLVSVTAMVLPSGHISRVSVSAPGQPAASIKCMEQNIAQGALKADVPKAPLQVQASLPFEVVAQTKPLQNTASAPTSPPSSLDVAKPEPGEVAGPDGTDFAQPSQ